MNRFYVSAAGYIVDRNSCGIVARLKDMKGWANRGARIVAELNANPQDINEILEIWIGALESDSA